MQRREVITLLGGAAASSVSWPRAARAQQGGAMRRIGVLMAFPENDRDAQTWLATFREGLQKLGWAEGRNIQFETRWAADAETMQRFAKELVASQPALVLSSSTPSTAALLQQTRSIPIIFAVVTDPVGAGFVASFPRPGGNATGFTNLEPTMAGKWIELLKEIAPRVTRIAAVFNPSVAPRSGSYFLDPLMTAARSFGVEAIAAPVHDGSELESVIATQAREPDGGLIVTPDTFTIAHRTEITALAARYRLPAVYPIREFTELGGLLSYGHDVSDNYRRVAIYADRILKGIKPSELPVQAPVKFEMVVNAKTAKALGLEMPPSFYWRADEVIE